MSNRVYEIVTEKIAEKLEQGEVPWHMPWHSSAGSPKNFVTMKDYRGINIILLSMSGYSCPYWISFKQVKEKGGRVKAGEKGTLIVFYKWLEHEDKENPEDVTRIPMLRYYYVFNLEQTTGIDFKMPEEALNGNSKIDNCENIVNGYIDKPKIVCSRKACYSPSFDCIQMPSLEQFESSEFYYSTLFHEMVHSTGHENRLNRRTVTDLCPFGSSNYSKEELVAEIGAAFLCGITGIENKTIDNSTAYIRGWLRVLRNDRRMVVLAAGAAQKAADYIQNRNTNKE